MWRFWRNPEFVRHARADLRLPRTFVLVSVVLVICALYALIAWTSAHSRGRDDREFFRGLYISLLVTQAIVLVLWCVTACSRAISGERELKAYDFVRATRLSPAELMLGKITGAPLTGYFVVACSLPISLVSGLLGGYSLRVVLLSYVLLLATALLVSLVSLCISMLAERNAPGMLVLGFFLLYPLSFVHEAFRHSGFPGFGAITPVPALIALHDPQDSFALIRPTLLGIEVSWTLLTLVLYASFSAWAVAMLRRNLKRELADISPLSRWQGLGFAVFINLLYFALLDPAALHRAYHRPARPDDFADPAQIITFVLLLTVGIFVLTPPERLKVWWRTRRPALAGWFSEEGPPAPWILLTGAMSFAFLAATAVLLSRGMPVADWNLHLLALQYLGFTIYAARDIMFLQWCTLTRMKQPIAKGILFLILYYTAAGIVVATLPDRTEYVLGGLLLDFGPGATVHWSPPAFLGGLLLQTLATYLIYRSMTSRLSRVPQAAAAA